MLFRKKKPELGKKGYLLVTTYDQKSATTLNFIYDRSLKEFSNKRIFDIGTMISSYYFENIDDVISEISGTKANKRFLANKNVTGIYYVELGIKISDCKYEIITESTQLYYVPSKLQLNVYENKHL